MSTKAYAIPIKSFEQIIASLEDIKNQISDLKLLLRQNKSIKGEQASEPSAWSNEPKINFEAWKPYTQE
jgi:hypothetical protein